MSIPTLWLFFQCLLGKIPKPNLETPVFLDPEGSQKPFAPHYERFIKPEIETFEGKRITALENFSQRCFGVLCVMVAIGSMGIVFKAQGQKFVFFEKIIDDKTITTGDLVQITLFIASMIITAMVMWCYHPVLQYNQSIKQDIFPRIFSFFGEDFHYAPKPAQTKIGSLAPSGILPRYHEAILKDSIQGSHQNVTLDIMWAHLKQRHGRSISTVFEGIFIFLSMNKRFHGKTVIKKDSGLLGNWAEKPSEDLEKVTLEDPRFEADFEVYASNQIEARYLLTPSFMERLQGLSHLFGGADIQASFYNQNLLLMIPLKKRYFSTGSIFQPATFTEEIQRILEEMNLICKIIEELKLHEKTGV